WPMRVAANRTNIAAAILAESGADEPSARRIEFYRGLLGEVDDPSGGGRISRQILAFDPARASLVELHGDLGAARSVAVLVPGVNTAIERSAANAATARRF
ncbi:alpha/beta hydrolase, partial [Enterococcus faecium]